MTGPVQRVLVLASVVAAVGAAPVPRAWPQGRQAGAGSVSPLVAEAVDLGRAASTAEHRVVVGLALRDRDALEAPTEVAEAAVVSHLERSGLRITDRAPNRLIVGARGSVAAIERAFGVAIHDVSFRGARHYAALEEPTFPADIADAVVGVIGLDDLVERQPRVRASGPVPAPHAALGSN